jgi:hypothetical protein
MMANIACPLYQFLLRLWKSLWPKRRWGWKVKHPWVRRRRRQVVEKLFLEH